MFATPKSKMSEYKLPVGIIAILFDKDGTLIDFEQSWGPVNRSAAEIASGGDRELAAHLLKTCGVDPLTGRTRADSLFAAGNTVEIARKMVEQGSAFRADELTDALDRLFASAAERAVPIAPLPNIFSSLRSRGYKLGIASSDNERSIRSAANHLGILSLVDFISGYDSGHGTKPSAGMVLGFAAEIGCEPANIAVVGDNRHDMEMGRAAGAGATIGVLSGTGTLETLRPLADACIQSVAFLPEIARAARIAEI
jgi:phosphoglycolate phosphatase